MPEIPKTFFNLKYVFRRPNEVELLNTIMMLSISLLLIVVFFVNQKFSETNDNFEAVSTANNMIIQTFSIETNFFYQANMVRTALLTNKENINDSLPIYHQQMNTGLANLRKLWLQNGEKRDIVDNLQILSDARYRIWQELLQTKTALNDSNQTTFILAGNKVFAGILKLTDEMKNTEYAHLNQSLQNSHKGIRAASLLIIIITFLSIALIVFAFTLINKEVLKGKEVSSLLENKVKELDRSNQQLEQFAYVASHDLHDPLRKLNVFSERLDQKEKERLSDEGKELIKRMQKLIIQMQHLIDGLLALSLNYNQFDKKDVNLNKILEDVKQSLSLKILHAGAIIQAPSLPIIQGYESQLEQLFQNLISNSIRYAQKGIAPLIILKCSTIAGSDIPGVKKEDKQKQFYKLTFVDNGIGFDNKYAQKIFVIFQRLHGKAEYEGSGIGLATCKLVVDNHNGYITANGKLNEGAEFSIYLPN
jgi:signal transduction histidine kinase